MPTSIARPGSPFKLIFEFHGGLNDSGFVSDSGTDVGDQQVDAHELSEVFNYSLHLPGATAVSQRPGLLQASTGVYDEAGQLVFHGIYDSYVCTLTKVWDDEATALDTGLTSSTTWDAASFNGKDIFVNGTEERETNDGTTFANVGGSPPNFKYIEVYNNHLFGAGHSQGTLRWSALENEDSWPTQHAKNITGTENDPITGLAKFRDVLMVFTRNRFFHFSGFDITDFGISHVAHEGPGCTAHRSIVVTDQGIAWWTQKGLAFSRDGFTVDLPMMRKMRINLTGIDQTLLQNVFGVWDPLHERVIYWVTTITAATRCIVYYYNRDVFFKWSDGIANATAAGIIPSGTHAVSWSQFPIPNVVGNINSELALFSFDGTLATDNGAAVGASLKSARIPLGESTSVGRISDITIESMTATNAAQTLNVWLDDTSVGSSATFSYTIAASSTIKSRSVKCRRRFKEIAVGLSESVGSSFDARRIIVRGFYVKD